MIRLILAFAGRLALVAGSLPLLALLAACSGAVGGSAPVVDPAKITILPSPATVYSGIPTTFVITGGTGSYIVASSDQTIIPIAGSISGNTVAIIANAVTSDTTVTLTVRDTGTTPTATVSVTVKSNTVLNTVAVSPTSPTACPSAICSGADALVTANLSQAGRSVRFDVISGDFRFITSTSSAGTETLDSSVTAVTDQAGVARARIRVLATAASQTALLQVTDLVSGAFRRASFLIASPALSVTPSSVSFQGRLANQCAGSDISATFYVFGGTPPYTVSNTTSALTVRAGNLLASGGSFTATPTGACIAVPGAPIVVSDASGRTATATVTNIPGTQAIPALAATPATVNLSTCDSAGSVQVAGGVSGTYFVASGSDALIATISGSTVTIQRRNPSGPAASSGQIGISDGASVVQIAVALSGPAVGACPSSLTASPSAVTLTDCTTSAQVLVTGGSGLYSAASDTGSVLASVAGSVVSIKRATGSPAFTTATVTISDGVSAVRVTVTGSGPGAAACSGGGGASDLAASPTTVTLNDCSSGALVTLSGGSGAYTAASSSSSMTATVTGNSLSIRRANPSAAFAGGSVNVSSGGATITVTVNTAGAGAGICPTPIIASPTTLTLTKCSDVASATISGGSGTYTATTASSAIAASISGNRLDVTRRASGSFTGGTVSVSDGSATTTVTVNATGEGGQACPPLAVSTNAVQITDCNSSPSVILSGGSGSYAASASTTSLTVNISGNILTIKRTVPSAGFNSATVTVTDTSGESQPISVTTTGPGGGSC